MQTYSDSELYDLFANQAEPDALVAQDITEMVAQLCDQIGCAESEGTRYPDDGDGMVDAYAIALAIKRQAHRIQAERGPDAIAE